MGINVQRPLLFEDRVSFADTDKIKDHLAHVDDVEIRPVIYDGDNVSRAESDNDAMAFGVYLNATDAAVMHELTVPSLWIADFETRQKAENFEKLLRTLLLLV